MKESINTILLVAILALTGYNTFFQGGSSSSTGSEAVAAETNNSDPFIAEANQNNRNQPEATFEPPKEEEPSLPPTSMKFEESEYDFGEIMEGEKVEHTFKFKNTGDKPLVISNAKGSCGCTVPSWPKEPIPPGGESEIQVVYDSKNKSGKQTKTVTITANTEPKETYLKITSQVKKDPNKPDQPGGGELQLQTN